MSIADEYEMILFRYKADLSWQYPEYWKIQNHAYWREHFTKLRQLELLYERI